MRTYYEERIVGWFLWGAVLVTIVVVLAVTAGEPGRDAWSWVAIAVAVAAVLLTGVMTVTVDREAVRLRALAGWPRQTVPLADVAHVEVAGGLIWRGGYGIKWSPGDTRWNLAGNRGVVLQRRGGGRVVIGCHEPERLARALERALRDAAGREGTA